jgi:hypothetical protein
MRRRITVPQRGPFAPTPGLPPTSATPLQPCADVEAIPDVNPPDRKKQSCQLLLVVMPGGLLPDFVGDRIRAVAEPRHSFREGQGRTFGICKVRRITPDGHGEPALIRFAGLPDRPRKRCSR